MFESEGPLNERAIVQLGRFWPFMIMVIWIAVIWRSFVVISSVFRCRTPLVSGSLR
jgi:hypothetical protein